MAVSAAAALLMSSSLAWPGYACGGAVRFIVSVGGQPGPVFCELRRDERLGCLPFVSGASAGSDLSHGSLGSVGAAGGCVRGGCESAWTAPTPRGSVKLFVFVLVEGRAGGAT